MRNEQKMECPPATQDVALNTKNRNATRDNHMYGPLNVKEPGDYWEKLAKRWKTTLEAAKKSKCGNCVAFDISPRMDECMPGSVSDESGRLGYCWMHHFKCLTSGKRKHLVKKRWHTVRDMILQNLWQH